MFTFKSLTAANIPKIIEASDHYKIKYNLTMGACAGCCDEREMKGSSKESDGLENSKVLRT